MSASLPEEEVVFNLIVQALFEDGLALHINQCQDLSAMIYTPTHCFTMRLLNGEVTIHEANVNVRRLKGEELTSRVRNFLLADPKLFENILEYVTNFAASQINGLWIETVSKRLDNVRPKK